MAAMEQRPVLLRTVIAAIIIGVLFYSILPLREKNFYDTFLSVVRDDGRESAQQLVDDAKARQAETPELFASNALLGSAEAHGVELNHLVDVKNAEDNRDVISFIRKASSASIRRGIDLNGGVEFILELVPDEEFKQRLAEADLKTGEDSEARFQKEFDRYRDVAVETLRDRLESNKIFESEIAPSGGSFISLKAPLVSKDEKSRLKDLLSMSARLHFRLVHPQNSSLVENYLRDPANFVAPIGYELMTQSEFRPGKEPLVRYYFVKQRWEMDGKGIVDARVRRDQYNQRQISLAFDNAGAKDFARVTKNHVGELLAIVLDGKLYSAPEIRQEIVGGQAEITGRFSDEEAQNVANALVSGSLPFQIRVDAVFDVDPTLGKDNVSSGVRAGLYAMIAVVVFMVGYYMIAGLIAVTALSLNVILVLGMLAAFDATLTLPGIAGIILTIGMAVDANVLIFERIREEMIGGKNLQSSIEIGYGKALSAVLDANITTLFTGLILYTVGTGAIKGFAVTLSIGIITSLFTALFITRLLFDYLMRFAHLKSLPMLIIFKHPNFDFLKCRKVCFTASLLLIIGSFIVMGVKGKNMFNVDLVGGTVVTYSYENSVSQQSILDTLKANGFANARVAYKVSSSDSKKLEVMVRNSDHIGHSSETPGEQIAKILNQSYPQLALTSGQEDSIGGLIGAEFSKAAIYAMICSLIGMIIYISLRYEFAYAMAGIIALLHDVIIATGIFVLLDRQISLSVIAALLTTIGYSINDTIVVFDRIREDLRINKGETYHNIINGSINLTLNRTLLTSLTTMIVVVVLLIFGGAAISDFVLLMLLGIVIGTYSSVFIASPIVALWHRKISGVKENDSNFDATRVVQD